MNRQCGSLVQGFFLFYNTHCLLTRRITVRYKAMLCEQKKICENLEIIDAANSDRVANWPCYLSPIHRKQIQNGGKQFAAVFLFRHRLNIVLYLAETEIH